MSIDRISVELTNKCQKGCWFCYNSSHSQGYSEWELPELVSFVQSCATESVRAVSFGGGEPLEYEHWHQLLIELRGIIFRSITTNGLPLQNRRLYRHLLSAMPDKVHVSIHFPDRKDELNRVVRQVRMLASDGVPSGINLLVSKSSLASATEAAKFIRDSGIDNQRIVYLPMRSYDTPSALDISRVAGGTCFQSMSCLSTCARSPRFCSIAWDKTVAWCSYTAARRKLPELTYRGLVMSIQNLDLRYCGDAQFYSIN